MPKGCIDKFNNEKGFGFIKPEGGGKDIFFHVNDFKSQSVPQPGDPVEFSQADGERGPKAINVKVISHIASSLPVSSSGSQKMIVYETFYEPGDDGKKHLIKYIFFEDAETTAATFTASGLTSTSFRRIFRSFQGIVGQLNARKISFEEAKELFGGFYAEKIVYVHRRKDSRGKPGIPAIVKDVFDKHKELVMSDKDEMIGFYKYLKYVLCYFDTGDK